MPDVGYFVRYFFLEWEQLEIYKSRGGIQMKYVFPEYKENVVLGDGKLQLNPMSYQVIYEGKEIDLTPREFEVLYLLAQRPYCVIPKKNIYCSVWESNYYDDQIPYKTVEHVVWKIRKKMGHDIIETLINVGYRLKKM